MKMVNNSDNTCSFGIDMPAYLYDELSSEGRERFESHLEGCGQCIDEFAELSEARYSVYEWRNLEFAPLATPRFVVPVERTRASVSWLDTIRAAFAWNGTPLIAGSVAVLMIGVFGLVMIFNSSDTRVATVIEQPVPPDASAPSPAIPPANTAEGPGADTPTISEPEVAAVAPRRLERENVAVGRQSGSATPKSLRKTRVEPVTTRRTVTNRSLNDSPTLGQYVEDRDESLRLSDLFDDLDSRELD